jgi:hypothetical protein
MVKKSSQKTPGLLKASAFLPLFCPSPRTAPARAGAAEPAASCRENVSFYLMTGMAMPYAKSTPFVLLVAENTPALPMSILLNLLAASPSPCDATRQANHNISYLSFPRKRESTSLFVIGYWLLDISDLSGFPSPNSFLPSHKNIVIITHNSLRNNNRRKSKLSK